MSSPLNVVGSLLETLEQHGRLCRCDNHLSFLEYPPGGKFSLAVVIEGSEIREHTLLRSLVFQQAVELLRLLLLGSDYL
jgi:hypothetical protein